MGWELREAKDYEEKNSKFWGHVGSVIEKKSLGQKRNFKISKISNGPNILTCMMY